MSVSHPMSSVDSDSVSVEEKIVKVNGDIAYRKYTRGRLLGKGGFAKVFELVNSDTKKVNAAKLISKSSLTKARARQKLMSEIKIHRSLHHDNIVAFEHFFEDADHVYILLELCPNQSLSDMMRRRKRVTELEAQCYMFQILSGIQYLHSHRIIHRDIKLGNLFLNEKMEVKIGDLGLAAKLEFDGERKRTICGTPNYIAPEILEGKQGHSYEVDVWSLGVLLYTFVVGKPPFETSDVKTTYRRIKMNAYSFPEHVPLSDTVKNLISLILQTEPSARPSIDDILTHPFFQTPFPKLLPASCLAVPPSSAFLKQYQVPDSIRPRLKREQTMPPRMLRSPDNRVCRMNSDNVNTPLSSPKAPRGSRLAALSSYTPTENGPKIWVSKWMDYSSKYGLGYRLSNNCAGVCFNDSTKIVSLPGNKKFQYTSKKGTRRQETSEEFMYSNYPSELHKKVTLLEHFNKHLAECDPVQDSEECVIIKKWLSTSHAMIFRLSNKIVQVCFQDKTELLLCSNTKQATYVSKLGEITTTSLKTIGEHSNRELSKRLKYTKDVLTNLLAAPSDNN